MKRPSRFGLALAMALTATVLSGVAAQPAPASSGPIISGIGSANNGFNWVLSATIDPGSVPAEYQFWLRTPDCASCVSYSEKVVGSGVVPGEAGPVQKSVELIEPEPYITYTYWVMAHSAGGTTTSVKGHFTPEPLPPPENEPTPYEPSLPPWAIEAGARAAEEFTRQAEEERAREEAAAGQAQHCTVPRLRGDTVPKARRLLHENNCWLGIVSHSRSARRHSRSNGREVVIRQSPPTGRQLAIHAQISVDLGSPSVLH